MHALMMGMHNEKCWIADGGWFSGSLVGFLNEYIHIGLVYIAQYIGLCNNIAYVGATLKDCTIYSLIFKKFEIMLHNQGNIV